MSHLLQDLNSQNMYDAGTAMSGFACFVTPDLARDLANDVMTLLSSTKPYLRKKAILLMYKIFLKFPEALRPAFPRLKEKLEDPDPGVQSAAVNVICELARKNPKNYLSLAPVFFKLMTSSTNNWMLIKIIKLFGALTPLEPRLGKKLIEPLTNLIHSTSAMSLLYECINTVIAVLISISSGMPNHSASIQLCVQKLRILIEDSDQNLKYLGLLAMSKILKTHPKSVQAHKDLVLQCLDDKDESIRLRALDLLYGMVSKKNLMEIVKKLMSHMDKAEGAQYRDELLSKIIDICSQNNYQYITNFEWYVSILVELTRIDGTKHGSVIASQMLDVAIRVQAIRNFAVSQMPELTYSRPTVKSLTFDRQTSWTVFKTQFDVVSSANGWNNRVKASQLVASLRGSAAEVFQGIPSDKLMDLTTIESALDARFGDSHLTQFYRTELKMRRQKPGESLLVLAADVELLMSLAYAECPQDVRHSLAAQYFVDAIRDEDTQHATRLMDAKDLKLALAYSMKYEAVKTVSKTSRNVRSIEIEDGTGKEKDEKFDCLLETLEKLLNSHVARKKTPRRNPNVICWKCNKKGHLQRECLTISPNWEKLMYGRLTGRRLPFLNKAPEEGLKVSTLCGGRNGLYLEGSICSIPCLMLVDTGANVSLVRTDLAQKLKENFIYTAPNISFKTATGEKAEIHGKLDAAIECGSRKFQHRIYVADITDLCILGLDFLQKFNFTVDLEKNEIWTGGEEIPLFSVNAEHSKLCSVLAKEKTIIPARSNVLSRESQKFLKIQIRHN
ncbi:AP-3 complex subunit delta-1 [Araneus ventricosus]|uniref:AP-3 complex subunit delta-1 n=1 Tax=Araneus ventricosus TaxID=182803 RepID=A0A4Y2FUU6_ARAVE|nr:AP-3 complex subunit delta-1 [Araneus ventricosus]